MPIDIVVPELGESITEGTITTWLVEVGEAVSEDQPLLELETEKVTAELPSPTTGVLVEIVVGDGEDVPVGAVVGRIEAGAAATVAHLLRRKPRRPPSPLRKPRRPGRRTTPSLHRSGDWWPRTTSTQAPSPARAKTAA